VEKAMSAVTCQQVTIGYRRMAGRVGSRCHSPNSSELDATAVARRWRRSSRPSRAPQKAIFLGCRHSQRDANGRLEAAAFTDAPFRK
jgi:hypothetical protein